MLFRSVLTFAATPYILASGAKAYADYGMGRSRGTQPFQLAGNIRRGGLVELAFGCTIRDLIEGFGGSTLTGKPVRAVQVGGPLGAYFPDALLDTKLDYEEMLGKKGMKLETPLFVRVFKEESELEVWKQRDDGRFYHFKTYPICNWSGTLGPKIQQGDMQAPEGFYSVPQSQMNPNSQYHLAFNLGYPNSYDRANRRTGEFLMIHGKCKSAGCYAMTDALIEEITRRYDTMIVGLYRDDRENVVDMLLSMNGDYLHALGLCARMIAKIERAIHERERPDDES